MGRMLLEHELSFVSGGNSGDETEEEDTVTTTGRQILNTFSGFGIPASALLGDAGDRFAFGEGDGEGEIEDVIVVIAEQVQDAQEFVQALNFLLSIQEAINNGLELIGFDQSGDPVSLDIPDSVLDEFFDIVKKTLGLIDTAATVADVVQLLASGELQQGLSDGLNFLIENSSTAAITAIFAAIGTASGNPVIGASSGLAGFLYAQLFNTVAEDERAFLSDSAADLLVDFIDAILDGAAALEQLLVDLGANLQGLGDVRGFVEDLDPIPDIPGAPPSDDARPSFIEMLFGETPEPGTQYR